jgi:hypothetical protein
MANQIPDDPNTFLIRNQMAVALTQAGIPIRLRVRAMITFFMLRPPAAKAAIPPTTSVDVREKRSLADHLLTKMVWAVCEGDWVSTARSAIVPT